MEEITINKPKINILSPFWNECINIAAPVAVTRAERDDTIGQGLASTK